MNTQTNPTEPITTLAPRRRHRLWGAIQNLPTRTRAWLNQSLRDGLSYKQIIATLEKKNRRITKQQLSKWVKTGYADWLAEQQYIETRKLHAEALAASYTRGDKSTRASLREAADLEFAVQIQDAIRLVNTEDLRNLFTDKPENFFRLIRAHAVQERNAIMRDRFQFEQKKHAAKEKKQKRAIAPKKIPTRMDIERYKRELKIVPAEYQPIEYGGQAITGARNATPMLNTAATPVSSTTPATTPADHPSHHVSGSQISNFKSQISSTSPDAVPAFQTQNLKPEIPTNENLHPSDADRLHYQI